MPAKEPESESRLIGFSRVSQKGLFTEYPQQHFDLAAGSRSVGFDQSQNHALQPESATDQALRASVTENTGRCREYS